jgi:hypothetical protein
MLTSLKIDLNEPYKTGFAKKTVLQKIGLGAELFSVWFMNHTAAT